MNGMRADRTIRVLIGLGIGAWYLAGDLAGALGVVLLILAVVLLATSAVGSCPAYLPCKISTRRQGPATSSETAAPRA